ncbi:hypothetical protein PG991_008193 [Apiospora marii]|uniref:F-box domain-containing protein n=1 Tax=Apiospora marii TaxID=335849 RepID=A0ABR1RQF4_9PEZI
MADNSVAPFLHRLPIEVVHLVVAQFCEHCRWEGALCAPVTFPGHDSHWMHEERYLADTQDLRSLSLVSRALRGPAQSVLHHMCMGGFSPNYQYAFRYTHLFRFIGAVATMKTPSHLVREVKALSLGHGHMQKMPKLWRRSLAMPEAAHLRACMGLSESNETNEIAKVDFIAKLITTFPSLTHLSLGECADDSSDRVPSCLEQAEELPLKSIHVCADPGGYKWSAEPNGLGKLTARVIALSKGLRMLAVDACIEPATILGHLQPRPSLDRLQVLQLTTAWLEEEELQQIVAACPTLCGLVYVESGVGPRNGRPKTLLKPLGVIRALDSCRHSLQSLDLQLAKTKDHNDTTAADSSRLAASFAGFTTLQDLTLQWRTICSPISNDEWQQLVVRALPDSIRSLSVVGCAEEMRPERFARALEGLAAAKAHKQRFPHLARVSCDVDAMMDSQNRPDHESYYQDVDPEHGGPPYGYHGYDKARDQEISFGLFDPGNSIREALGAAGVRKVEYSMAWRTGFWSRARERAAQRGERHRHLPGL